MTFVYLPERVADQSPRSGCSDGTPSATSSGTNTASKSCRPESETACLTMPPYGTTLEHSTGDPGADAWILSLRASRASRSVALANEREPTTSETCGPIQSESYAKFDRDTHSWRTSQACLFQDTSAVFSETWPRAGTILDGAAYRRQRWERRIAEIGCGLWPTANSHEERAEKYTLATSYKHYQEGRQVHLSQAVRDPRMWPTPHKSCGTGPGTQGDTTCGGSGHKAMLKGTDLEKGRGTLNPTWVEWLMGWPLGWTDLKPLAMDRFRKWLRKHGSC